VAMQCPSASVVGGFRQWIAQGRCVIKGQHGIGIWIPTKKKGTEAEFPKTITEAVAQAPERHGFIFGTVFDIGQTAPLDSAIPETVSPQAIVEPEPVKLAYKPVEFESVLAVGRVASSIL